MGRKDRKRRKPPTRKKKKDSNSKPLLCSFGFKLKPRCGALIPRFDLTKRPDLRAAIRDGVIPPYCYQFEDENTVLLDQCLICHVSKGFTIQEYERRNEEAGITRSNYKQIEPMLKRALPDVLRKIEEERRELVRRGAPFTVIPDKNLRDS